MNNMGRYSFHDYTDMLVFMFGDKLYDPKIRSEWIDIFDDINHDDPVIKELNISDDVYYHDLLRDYFDVPDKMISWTLKHFILYNTFEPIYRDSLKVLYQVLINDDYSGIIDSTIFSYTDDFR